MDKITDLLKGKKTYIQAIAAGVIVVLFSLGYVEKDMAVASLGLLGAGSVMSLGAKIDRSSKK
jgi:hypothetical protein